MLRFSRRWLATSQMSPAHSLLSTGGLRQGILGFLSGIWVCLLWRDPFLVGLKGKPTGELPCFSFLFVFLPCPYCVLHSTRNSWGSLARLWQKRWRRGSSSSPACGAQASGIATCWVCCKDARHRRPFWLVWSLNIDLVIPG